MPSRSAWPLVLALVAPPAPATSPAPAPLREYVRVVERPYLRVRLTVTVTDRRGLPVRGLKAGDFRIFEGDTEYPVDEIGGGARRQRPLSVAVLLDFSESMGGQVKKVKEAATALLASLRPGDEIMVAKFNDELTVLQDFTAVPADPEKSLKRVGTTYGGTAIFRSVQKTLGDLRDRPGRKVILVVSDGLDNDIERAGSVYQSLFLQDLVRMCYRTQTTVYGVRPGMTNTSWMPFEGFVEETGGRLLYSGGDLATLFARLGEEFSGQYDLAYDVDPKQAGARRRRIRVEVRSRDAVVRTVRGFTSARDDFETQARDASDEDAETRAAAVFDLSFHPDPRVPDLVMKAAADADGGVRRVAAQALGRLREERALPTLVVLMGDPLPEVRRAAVEAMDGLGDRSLAALVPECARLVGADPAGLRLESVVLALGRVGDDRALGPLGAALRSGGAAARQAAAEALGDLGLSGGIPALREALRDPVGEVRGAAAAAIVRIAGGAAREVIEAYIAQEKDPRLRESAQALLR